MAETAVKTTEKPESKAPPPRGRIAWGELGPRIVPLLAVITAMLFGGVFMVLAGADWDAARQAGDMGGYLREIGLGIAKAGTAYEALIEGATGLGYIDPASIRAQTTVITLLPLGDRSIVFIPGNLIDTIVRSIPFILAGLAVALGFKCGLFNIGAEGQLYAGALLSVTVGFHPAFAGLPGIIHIPLAIVAGILGGMIWAAIPGFLKAKTGAHEVINTIMMNAIAIRLADWLIKSREPLILLDVKASVPRTPYIADTAMYPRLGDTPLHFGLLVALAAAGFVWWVLYRTNGGFEMRTVGANPSAG